MSYGPNPWQQAHWDWRAAGNFMCGGAGGGLILMAALSGARGLHLAVLQLAGVALVGAGLTCVWLELGRPLRALHVFINPRTSWMTREAFVATLLMPAALAAAAAAGLGLSGLPGVKWLAAALALGFVYCQSRMLHGAKGIPAWRAPMTVPLIVTTGVAEGAGYMLLLAATLGVAPRPKLLAIVGALVLARAIVWWAYRRSVAPQLAPRALQALDAAGRWLEVGGTAVPLLALTSAAVMGGALALPLLALGGVLVAATGAWFKFAFVTRAGFNQGFALKHVPVRGVPR